MTKLKINKEYSFSKVGVNEVEGLKDVMIEAIKPIQQAIQEHKYWGEVELRETEYNSRDGFIAYGHNCGGIEISEIIPECERYNFEYIAFGECDDEECIANHDNGCSYGDEGHLDAKLRVWLKFEGLNENDEMEFYLYLGGGNGDAPYFRTKDEATVFESQFTVKSLAEFKRVARMHVSKLLKKMA